jgi:prevent-host-death family protein
LLEAKNQLSRLVKAALAGEEVIIASHGQPRVRLVPCSESPGLRHCGALSGGIKEKERSLIAQARMEGLMAVSADAHWPAYDLHLHRA